MRTSGIKSGTERINPYIIIDSRTPNIPIQSRMPNWSTNRTTPQSIAGLPRSVPGKKATEKKDHSTYNRKTGEHETTQTLNNSGAGESA